MSNNSESLDEFWTDFKTKQEEQNAQTRERDGRYSYAILKNVDSNDLELEVIKFMKEGWKPTGGVSILLKGANVLYCQAMVRS